MKAPGSAPHLGQRLDQGLIWVSAWINAHQMTRRVEGALFSHSFQSVLQMKPGNWYADIRQDSEFKIICTPVKLRNLIYFRSGCSA